MLYLVYVPFTHRRTYKESWCMTGNARSQIAVKWGDREKQDAEESITFLYLLFFVNRTILKTICICCLSSPILYEYWDALATCFSHKDILYWPHNKKVLKYKIFLAILPMQNLQHLPLHLRGKNVLKQPTHFLRPSSRLLPLLVYTFIFLIDGINSDFIYA